MFTWILLHKMIDFANGQMEAGRTLAAFALATLTLVAGGGIAYLLVGRVSALINPLNDPLTTLFFGRYFHWSLRLFNLAAAFELLALIAFLITVAVGFAHYWRFYS